MRFKPGDIVTLKTGGPRMVVSKISWTGRVADCVWWPSSDGQHDEYGNADRFYVAALERAS